MVIDTKIDYGGDGGYVGGDGDGYGYGGGGYGGDGYGGGYGGGGYGGDGYGGYGYGGGGGGYGGDGYGGGGYGGDGYGDGCGGYGYGYGVGGDGCGGYGYGYGGGGYGYGGGGNGYGYGYGELVYPESAAFLAYHYIKKTKHGFVMRNGTVIQPGQVCEEPKIEMCKIGLHSSMTPVEAKKYAPEDSVLTQVKVWGRVIFGKDKLVSTHRKLIK